MDNKEDGPITIKIKGLPQIDERVVAQQKYDKALATMLKDPTNENIAAFGQANCDLYEVEDKYRIARRLLMEYKTKHSIEPHRNNISYNETKHIQIRR